MIILERADFEVEMESYLRRAGYKDQPNDDSTILSLAKELLADYLAFNDLEYGDPDYCWDSSSARMVVDKMELSLD